MHILGSDVRKNILDAIRVVTQTCIHEIMIVFNSKILRGNRSKKFREVEFEAFESIGMLPLGIIEHEIRHTGENYCNDNVNSELTPDLAESYEISEDQKVYTIKFVEYSRQT